MASLWLDYGRREVWSYDFSTISKNTCVRIIKWADKAAFKRLAEVHSSPECWHPCSCSSSPSSPPPSPHQTPPPPPGWTPATAPTSSRRTRKTGLSVSATFIQAFFRNDAYGECELYGGHLVQVGEVLKDANNSFSGQQLFFLCILRLTTWRKTTAYWFMLMLR